MLFLANLIGITLSASVVFLSQRYGHWHQAGGHLMLWLILLVVISGPLSGSMGGFLLEQRVDDEISNFSRRFPKDAAAYRFRALEVQAKHRDVTM